MGACFPFSSWIAEDDALLKKAVEAGASLESLAKGAVCFSRRFTIRELQERWLALLYNPEISADASAQIVKLQNSDQNHQKPIKSCNVKGKETGKRKLDSVRSHYYAMRKKICQESCDPFALNHLMPPNAHIYIGNCMSGAPISEDFVLPETGFNIEGQSFPTSVGAASHSFHTEHANSLGDGLRDCLYGFGGDNVSPLSVENGANGLEPSLNNVDLQKDIPHILRDDTEVFQNVSVSLSQTLPADDLFGAHDSEMKSLPDFDHINGNLERVCSGFEASQSFSSPVSDCSAQFQQLGYSSPQSSIPIWRTMEELSAPSMSIEDKEQSSGQKLVDGIHDDELNHSIVVSEGDFIDLSNSLLNFENEDILYMTMGGKDMMDRSPCLDGIGSILLSSPNDLHHDDAPKSGDPKASLVLDTCLMIPDGGCAGVVDEICDSLGSGKGDGPTVCNSAFNISATSSRNHGYPSLTVCVLNTEDPEIPNNDDIIFPPRRIPPIDSSQIQHNSDNTTSLALSSAEELSNNWKAGEQEPPLIKEEPETPAPALVSQALPEMGSQHPSCGHRVKTELPDCDFVPSVSKGIATGVEDPKSCPSVSMAQHSTPISNLKEGISAPELEKGDADSSRSEKPDEGFSQTKSYPSSTIVGCKQEVDMLVAEHGSRDMGVSAVASFSNSDQEEQLSECEDDVPYFSDVEAMILDMDLGPEDLDSFLAREVARYQNENTKKAIIRLEQGAHSCMRRAASFHGAYAVFYGRYLKYYIKKPKVSLGRATSDSNVDIDLGREGRANKISRRQAIIKMEEDGSFYLKNLGKHGILVNNTEIASGQRFKLRSNCLIEIRDMRFIFETNQKLVMQYVANIAKKESQDK